MLLFPSPQAPHVYFKPLHISQPPYKKNKRGLCRRESSTKVRWRSLQFLVKIKLSVGLLVKSVICTTYQVLKGFESTSTMVPFTMTPISLKSLLALLYTTFKMGHSNSTSVETNRNKIPVTHLMFIDTADPSSMQDACHIST